MAHRCVCELAYVCVYRQKVPPQEFSPIHHIHTHSRHLKVSLGRNPRCLLPDSELTKRKALLEITADRECVCGCILYLSVIKSHVLIQCLLFVCMSHLHYTQGHNDVEASSCLCLTWACFLVIQVAPLTSNII